jgi:hypothetical protein
MSTSASAPPPVKPGGFLKWHRAILGICLVIFAFELGLFLLVFPWLSGWDSSYIPVHSPQLSDVWTSPYFRGVVSGLGLINIYIAVAEAIKQLKAVFSRSI